MKNTHLAEASKDLWVESNITLPGNEALGDLYRSLTGTLMKPFDEGTVSGFIKNVVASRPRTESNRSLDRKIMAADMEELKNVELRKPPFLKESFLRYATVIHQLLNGYTSIDTTSLEPICGWLEGVVNSHNSEVQVLQRFPKVASRDVEDNIKSFKALFNATGKLDEKAEMGTFQELFPTLKHFVTTGEEVAALQETVDTIRPERLFRLEERILDATRYYNEHHKEIDVKEKEMRKMSEHLRLTGRELEFMSVLLLESKRISVLFNEYVDDLKKAV